jgi:hypothetical protein
LAVDPRLVVALAWLLLHPSIVGTIAAVTIGFEYGILLLEASDCVFYHFEGPLISENPCTNVGFLFSSFMHVPLGPHILHSVKLCNLDPVHHDIFGVTAVKPYHRINSVLIECRTQTALHALPNWSACHFIRTSCLWLSHLYQSNNALVLGH